MATHCSILAWEILWTKSLVGYSPWGCKELDITEQLNHNLSLQICQKRKLGEAKKRKIISG